MKCKYCKDKLQNYKELKERGYCYKKKCNDARKRRMRI